MLKCKRAKSGKSCSRVFCFLSLKLFLEVVWCETESHVEITLNYKAIQIEFSLGNGIYSECCSKRHLDKINMWRIKETSW